ncbi:MAG: helix-turn-helix domain-containing protein [Gordonia sp. (in: high G+C Gram-positive bacteria)]|uniref:PucR family transcriptional regulator n=1 Tax=Gordonia sp. (in: high G+C Gram-positive bacteria) TaxID=84139 RepID=UPI003C7614A9
MTDLIRSRASTVGRELGADQLQLSAEVSTTLARGISSLNGDPALVEMLGASVEGNVANIVHVLANDIPIAHLQPPTAAVEYALRLAQRDIPSNALVRAYHMGQNVALQRCYEIVARMALTAAETVELTAYISEVLYSYIDWITAKVFAAYEDERRRWIGTQGTVLSSTVHNLLAAPDTARATFERETGYRLDRDHRALIIWLDEQTGAELADLDREARRLAAILGSDGTPLLAPMDGSTLWVWIPFAGHGSHADPATALRSAGLPDGARAALGSAGWGAHGFCHTHEQARAAFRVATVPDSPTGPVVDYGDRGIAIASMLAQDVAATRSWVREILGGLAEDNAAVAPLRETLAVFLDTADSHVRTAERLNMHRNTVKYRIDKALSMLRTERSRLDLALALNACEFLGPLVLAPAR